MLADKKEPDVQKIADHYAAILTEIGADLTAEGLRETPLRAARALVEMTEGSRMDTDNLTKMFKAECKKAVCHDMVIVEGIHEVGLCEHHLLPILMNITIAYVPDARILGLSKLSRIAGHFARRWQNQEPPPMLSPSSSKGSWNRWAWRCSSKANICAPWREACATPTRS
jgi:GTP cyclohydrolase IA